MVRLNKKDFIESFPEFVPIEVKEALYTLFINDFTINVNYPKKDFNSLSNYHKECNFKLIIDLEREYR